LRTDDRSRRRERRRRDLAVAALLSLVLHVLAAAVLTVWRSVVPAEIDRPEIADRPGRSTSITFVASARPRPTPAPQARRTAASSATPYAPANVTAPAASRTIPHPAESRTHPAHPKSGSRLGPSAVPRATTLETTVEPQPAAPPAAPPASEEAAARQATAKLQSMLDAIAAQATAAPPVRATSDAAVLAHEARSGYDALIDPPADIVSRAIRIIAFKRTAGSPDSVVYILKHRRILGVSFCTGWSIVAHPLNGGVPQTGYYDGPCNGDGPLPAWADELPRIAGPAETPEPDGERKALTGGGVPPPRRG